MSYDKKTGLVLQGGGALGSYQAGVYEALAADGSRPMKRRQISPYVAPADL
jgi:predicted acylesterase/phospholipase RssA